jgi:hypothetical protein
MLSAMSQDPGVVQWVLQSSNSLGYARAESWSPGLHSQALMAPEKVTQGDSPEFANGMKMFLSTMLKGTYLLRKFPLEKTALL